MVVNMAGSIILTDSSVETNNISRRKEREQLDALKQHHQDEIDHHKKEIERLQQEIKRHQGKIKELKD